MRKLNVNSRYAIAIDIYTHLLYYINMRGYMKMTGTQIQILILLLIMMIICFFTYNIILGLIIAITTIFTANIFKIYNNYKKAEIEKEIYKEIKNEKKNL